MVGIRRANAGPGDQNYITRPNQLPSIEEWVAQKDKFRAVGHGVPMMLPQIERSSPVLETLFQDVLEPEISRVLYCNYIAYYSARLGAWRAKGVGEVCHTILICTNDTNPSSWKAAAKEILSVFQKELPTSFTGKIQVEIQNERLMYNDVSHVLPNNPALLRCLEGIQPGVAEAVRASLESCWSSIAYHTLVPNGFPPETMGRYAVIVSCHSGSREDFKAAEDHILEILDKVPFDIYLEFSPGEISFLRGNDGPRFLPNITEPPVNGASISVAGNYVEPGSLGGWVWLNIPHKDIRMRCALTCYHVVRSMDDTTAAHTDINGVVPDDPRGRTVAEYPAACDAAYTMKVLINVPPRDHPNEHNIESQFNVLSGRMVDPVIGRVIFASGGRVRDSTRVDWALILSPGTFVANKPPPVSTFGPFSLPPCGSYFADGESRVKSFGQVKCGDWVAKFGRTSETTSGVINRLYREVRWPSGMRSFEMEVLSPDGDFSRPGDSGSMVINSKGEFVGLVLARDSSAPFGATYITPISLIQSDIKERTGGGFLSLDCDDSWFVTA
ncbi:hypothetical protein McanMca71_004557 [Microsporum canis]|uniref:Uncharacterized protein n=1 Tax=Arthroderma otae (strain ATCC MYA-4605 / CBS 113480) TaxID=554155 RepID=C5FN96_ARTOC|nr:uncharacterized protein MCYG_04151 [Microsporum canis CBS 113480]EEQ31332.1 predicted protein [Microsporum canis CBS 113480]